MKMVRYSLNIIYMWQSQSPSVETQQNDQPELQITLQEVIDMIDITAHEETMAHDGSHEETMAHDGSHEEMMAHDGSHEEMMAHDSSHEEMMAHEDVPWFDWVV